MKMKTEEKIIELRKALREEYSDIALKYYSVMLEMDEFLEQLYNGLTKKEEKVEKEVKNV